jgi:putative two-component system response regulator
MGSKRILCIEDDPASRLLIRKILEGDGFEFHEADNGIEGVRKAREIRPDLILMDMNIPGMDGYEATTRIKGIPDLRDIPIVALTGQSGQGDRERSLIAGCDGYLAKPIIARDLSRKLQGYLTGTRERVKKMEEGSYLREYSLRLVNKLEGKIHELAEKNIQLREYGQTMERVYIGVMSSLMNAMEQKDPYTAGHSSRVTRLALAIGRRMRLTTEDLNTLTRAGELHDVGKLIIDLSSINKTGQLTEEEWIRMKEHPTIGARILTPLTFLHREIPIVAQHHERWDGQGYPNGLTGKDLGLLTCIITAADSCDAMTSARCYRDGVTAPAEVIEEIDRCRAAQFHPDVADTLISLIEEERVSLNR